MYGVRYLDDQAVDEYCKRYQKKISDLSE
jgi:hypothetical protein